MSAHTPSQAVGERGPRAPEGRGQLRLRRAALAAVAAFGAKGLGIVTTLISVPLTISYLGAERYGLWMTISAIVALLGFADFGIGNGLLNGIAEAHGKDDPALARRYVSSACLALTLIAAALGMAFAIAYPLIDWAALFNVASARASDEAGPAMIVFAACFLVGMPLTIVQRVQLGYQEGFASNLWQGLASLVGLAGILAVIGLRGGLPWLVLASIGAPAITALVNSAVVFGWQRPTLRPSFAAIDRVVVGRIVRMGGLFFVLQVIVALAFSADNLIAARLLGAEAVTQYAVPMRLFSVIPLVLGLMITPLWPAYGEAIARGDIAWVRRTLTRSLVLMLPAAGLPAIALLLLADPILHLWIGDAVTAPLALKAGLACWVVVLALGNTLAMFLNGAGLLKAQVIVASVMCVTTLALKIVLTQRMGLPGLAWGAVAGYLLCSVAPYVVIVPRKLAALEQAASRPGERGTVLQTP